MVGEDRERDHPRRRERRTPATAHSPSRRVAYTRLEPNDFSRDVLERYPERLAVLPVTGTAWTDLGDPVRALATSAVVQRQLRRRRTGDHGFPLRPASGDPEDRTRPAASAS